MRTSFFVPLCLELPAELDSSLNFVGAVSLTLKIQVVRLAHVHLSLQPYSLVGQKLRISRLLGPGPSRPSEPAFGHLRNDRKAAFRQYRSFT